MLKHAGFFTTNKKLLNTYFSIVTQHILESGSGCFLFTSSRKHVFLALKKQVDSKLRSQVCVEVSAIISSIFDETK
jgi:hypothetical protein